MKKVLIITYYWPPSGGGGVQRWVKFVKYLREFEVEPIVLTVNPESASFPVIDSSLIEEIPDNQIIFSTRSFEPLDFYRNINPKKEIPFGGFANEKEPGFIQKFARFIRGNLFIPDARVGWNSYAFSKACEIIEKYDIDTLITTSPPHSTQLIGRKLKRKYELKWITDLRDPWTDIYYYDKLYHTCISAKIDRKYELSVLEESDSIIVVSNAIKRLFAEKIADGDSEKIHVIPNGYDEPEFNMVLDESDQPSLSEFAIVYTGTIADNYNIDGFLKALNGFYTTNPEAKIKLIFVGRVSDNYKEKIKSLDINKICEFFGHVDHKKSISFLLKSTALFLSIPDVSNNEGILTGKLFEYLAAEKPIIGVGPEYGDAAKIINDCDAGRMFKYNDVDSITNYIQDLYGKWVNNATEKRSDGHLKYSRKN